MFDVKDVIVVLVLLLDVVLVLELFDVLINVVVLLVELEV